MSATTLGCTSTPTPGATSAGYERSAIGCLVHAFTWAVPLVLINIGGTIVRWCVQMDDDVIERITFTMLALTNLVMMVSLYFAL